MPPIIIALLAGAGLYVGYKMLKGQAGRTRGELNRRDAGKGKAKELGELELDPKTGEYRPKRKM